jgi:hypothetical protein
VDLRSVCRPVRGDPGRAVIPAALIRAGIDARATIAEALRHLRLPSAVVGALSAGVVASAPSGPGQHQAGLGAQRPGKRDQQAADLRHGERDQAKPAGQACGCRESVHLTRPGRTRGSTHRDDRAVEPAHGPLEPAGERFPAVVPDPAIAAPA